MWFISVEYVVDEEAYKVTEQLKSKITDVHKIAGIPIGVRSVYCLENIEVGTVVKVCYNPEKPKKAYMPENIGVGLM